MLKKVLCYPPTRTASEPTRRYRLQSPLQRWLRMLLLVIISAGMLPLAAQSSLFGHQNASGFVRSEQAFSFDFHQQGPVLKLIWQIRPGYYLYRQQIKLTPLAATLGEIELPAGQLHRDEFFGETQIYRQTLQLAIPITQAGVDAQVSVTWQGCAEAGFCYPPETRQVPLNAVVANATRQTTAAPTVQLAPVKDIQQPFSPLWALLIGIGIAFTPCVLPMYPLISGIILGNGAGRLSSGRIFLLSMVYVQGMAVTYTLLGIAVAAAGLQLQAALQQPFILIGLSVLFMLLAAAMFGAYSLQLPSSVQTRLTLWSNQLQPGALAGVFAMGALAGLFCSPCTTAPLSAILLYIAQSGNLLTGGLTLYLYALGMGIPLVVFALFGHRLLPRSGPWMQRVKEGFGFVILALPVFLLERVLGDEWGSRLWSLLAVSFLGWALLAGRDARYRGNRVVAMVLLLMMIVAARPLQDWAFGSNGSTAGAPAAQGPVFARVVSVADINRALAASPGKPAMLDLYADWCVACKEFEKYTFTDPAVKQELAGFTLLQADVTADQPDQKALLNQLKVMGLPTLLFFDDQGHEIPGSRVTGFMQARDFQSHLHNIAG
ncbi:thiol:disulfide interchange protein DsbD [Biostraticola tofi]|uniref:Thiol:disulfide interchange protein DsbD n=2 Tax=Biostraticola tofi TaxID=466109 RepID=A0A4R3Z4Y7_9GAMM|nr:thiol:disulfide interchange protein DsbD [Biostraticola tofi]